MIERGVGNGECAAAKEGCFWWDVERKFRRYWIGYLRREGPVDCVIQSEGVVT